MDDNKRIFEAARDYIRQFTYPRIKTNLLSQGFMAGAEWYKNKSNDEMNLCLKKLSKSLYSCYETIKDGNDKDKTLVSLVTIRDIAQSLREMSSGDVFSTMELIEQPGW